MDVFRAFTSGMIIRKMRRQGTAVDTVREALEKLKQKGYKEAFYEVLLNMLERGYRVEIYKDKDKLGIKPGR